MERLDRYARSFEEKVSNCFKDCEGACVSFIENNKCECQDAQILNWIMELKAYKDADEQGLLFRFPCKVGDTVYYIKGGYYKEAKYCEVKPIKVTEISLKNNRSGKNLDWAIIANGTRYKISSIGKTVFLTKEEAEKALEEMKGGRDEIGIV